MLLEEKNKLQKTPLAQLILQLSKIPGLGSRSAKRMVYHLIEQKEETLIPLLEKLAYVKDYVKTCEQCHHIAFSNLCEICENSRRDKSLLCIVEKPQNIEAIESSMAYHGYYHVLGGVLSVFDGITPDELHIRTLEARLQTGEIKEVIFALPATQDGRTTILYLTDAFEKYNIPMTLLAQGMPLGSDLDYLDQGTLMTAFKGRKGL